MLTAIGISLAWHLFWVSAVKVVSSPVPARPGGFGKVSFLGPIASRSGVEFRLSPREKSFLEKRYMRRLDDIMSSSYRVADTGYSFYKPDFPAERGVESLIANAVSGAKEEPGNTV